jgi:DNA-directed RNA polymerase subunit RPC12/RpoP
MTGGGTAKTAVYQYAILQAAWFCPVCAREICDAEEVRRPDACPGCRAKIVYEEKCDD